MEDHGRRSFSQRSRVLSVFIAAWALAWGRACVDKLDVSAARCPCAMGWTCCACENRCTLEPSNCDNACYDGGTGDAGNTANPDATTGDAGSGKPCQDDYACSIGAECGPLGLCQMRDYGDIGSSCEGQDCSGCASGLAVMAGTGGRICTGFCCTQNDCPPNFVCRPVDLTASEGGRMDICIPAAANNRGRRAGEFCREHDWCRSNICARVATSSVSVCLESCCVDGDCLEPTQACKQLDVFGQPRGTFCFTGDRVDDLGQTQCDESLWSAPSDCDLRCTSFVTRIDGCQELAECGPHATFCEDVVGDTSNECGHDSCTKFCCSTEDCEASVSSAAFFCGTSDPHSGFDTDQCLLKIGDGFKQEGEACAGHDECASNVCVERLCRERCCTPRECRDPRFSRCQRRNLLVHTVETALTVCVE